MRRGLHTFVCIWFNWPRNHNEISEMKISMEENERRENTYIAPETEIILLQHECSIMSGDDDDNTGGTIPVMPWD